MKTHKVVKIKVPYPKNYESMYVEKNSLVSSVLMEIPLTRLSYFPDKTRNVFPSMKKLKEYWWEFFVSIGKFDSRYEFEECDYCWACGMTIDGAPWTERAHILPRVLGGDEEPMNVNLLCRSCHINSENLYGSEYLNWLMERTRWDAMWDSHILKLEDSIRHQPGFCAAFSPAQTPNGVRGVKSLSRRIQSGCGINVRKLITEALNVDYLVVWPPRDIYSWVGPFPRLRKDR
jgi:hypothetical protein